MFIPPFTHRRQNTRSTGGRVVRMTKPSTAPAQAATRRQQPRATNMHAKQVCEVEPQALYYTDIDDPDQIYAEMDN